MLAGTPLYGTVAVSPEEMSEASQWVAAKFKGVGASESYSSAAAVLVHLRRAGLIGIPGPMEAGA